MSACAVASTARTPEELRKVSKPAGCRLRQTIVASLGVLTGPQLHGLTQMSATPCRLPSLVVPCLCRKTQLSPRCHRCRGRLDTLTRPSNILCAVWPSVVFISVRLSLSPNASKDARLSRAFLLVH
jgi:hypothetical protein